MYTARLLTVLQVASQLIHLYHFGLKHFVYDHQDAFGAKN